MRDSGGAVRDGRPHAPFVPTSAHAVNVVHVNIIAYLSLLPLTYVGAGAVWKNVCKR